MSVLYHGDILCFCSAPSLLQQLNPVYHSALHFITRAFILIIVLCITRLNRLLYNAILDNFVCVHTHEYIHTDFLHAT